MNKTILFLLLATGVWGQAQTNNAAGKPASRPTTEITSDSAEFDMSAHRAIYRGSVKMQNPDVQLTCGWLVVDLPSEGGHLSGVVAETNVVIDFTDFKKQTYHVTAAKAVYAYKVEGGVTNETITFTGSPKVETAQSVIESEPMVWDRIRNRFTFTAPKMISRENPVGNSATNAMPLNLF